MKKLIGVLALVMILCLAIAIPGLAVKIAPYSQPLHDIIHWDARSEKLIIINPENEKLTVSWPNDVDLWNYDGATWTFDLPDGDQFEFLKTVNISITSTATTGTVRSESITQTVGAAGAIHEALYVLINSEFATGSWVNAIVGRIDYGAAGSASGGMAAAICAELNMPARAVPGGAYTVFDAELEIPTDCVLIDNTQFPVSFYRAGLWGDAKGEFDDHGYLLWIDGLTDETTHCWYDNTLKILVGHALATATEWYIPMSSAQASYTTAYPIASTSTTGFLSTATFDPDENRTDYALAVGTTANALDVSMITATNENLNPVQLNINIIGDAPTSSTVNMIHSLITHTTTEMPALRLKCADWNVVFDKNVKDVFVIQTEMTITGDSTIAGDAFAASFYANVGTGTISAKKFGGLFVVVSGSAGVTSDQSRYSVARFLAAGGSSVDNILELKTDATSTATKGIYIYSQGTIVTGIDIGSCTTGIDFTGTFTTAAISMDSATFAALDNEIEMRNTVTGDKTVIASGSAADDAAIEAAVGADADIADGSLYLQVVDGAGALYIKKNDIWTAFANP